MFVFIHPYEIKYNSMFDRYKTHLLKKKRKKYTNIECETQKKGSNITKRGLPKRLKD